LQHLFIFYRIGAGSAGPARFEPRDALCADILVLSVILAIFNPEALPRRAALRPGDLRMPAGADPLGDIQEGTQWRHRAVAEK
jgi:hypothetical protein